MSNYNMDQYTLQSYFKSLCNSFYIAYKEVKKLEQRKQEIEDAYPQEELEAINMLLENPIPDSLKSLVQVVSEEELGKKKKELEMLQEKYEQDSKELEYPLRFWSDKLWKDADRINRSIINMLSEGFTIIVTSKEEVIALMAFFREHYVSEYRVINTDENCLKSFPAEEKMYEEFFAAYCLGNNEKMKEVCKKYF